MAGDTVTIGTYAWYQGTVEPPPSGVSNLSNALTGNVIRNSHGLYDTTDNGLNTIFLQPIQRQTNGKGKETRYAGR